MSDSEDEAIVVTRQEEEIDPEAEAEFDREYARMMAESLESRKFDRKPMFDVPLPMRRKDRDAPVSAEPSTEDVTPVAPQPTMAFSLLTKRGNRQQVDFPKIFLTSATLIDIDSYCGAAVRFDICYSHEIPATGRTCRTATHQKFSVKLRLARWRRTRQ